MTDITHKKKISAGFFLYVLLGCALLITLNSARSIAAPPATAVLYPDIREPFRSVFLDIAKGIGESLNGEISLRALNDQDTTSDILDWIKEENLKVIVALGSQAYSMSGELSKTVPVVIGGIQMSPELLTGEYYGITLNADPFQLLRQLKVMTPRVKRIAIVYDRNKDAWMIDSALRAAHELGLILNAVPVENLQEAANKYREILNNQESGTDALWLPQNSAVLDEQAVLPMILKEAWDKRLIVFTSNPSFVKKGVLFALYPDNYNMGRSLGEMTKRLQASGYQNNASLQNIEPLRDLLIAFNVRTAAHLDINYSREDLNKFDLVFPSR